MQVLFIFERPKILKPAQVLPVDLAVVLASSPAPVRMRAGVEEQTVGIAPQLGDRMQLQTDDFINVFLLRKVAVDRMISDRWRQTMMMLAQLLAIEIDQGLLLLRPARGGERGRRLRHLKRESATTRDIHQREGGNFQPTFGSRVAAVEEVAQSEGLLPAFRNKGCVLRRDPDRVGLERLIDHSLMKVRPVEVAPEMPRKGAFGVVAVATQVAKVDAPSQGEDRGKESFKELPLRLLNRRHLLQQYCGHFLSERG